MNMFAFIAWSPCDMYYCGEHAEAEAEKNAFGCLVVLIDSGLTLLYL